MFMPIRCALHLLCKSRQLYAPKSSHSINKCAIKGSHPCTGFFVHRLCYFEMYCLSFNDYYHVGGKICYFVQLLYFLVIWPFWPCGLLTLWVVTHNGSWVFPNNMATGNRQQPSNLNLCHCVGVRIRPPGFVISTGHIVSMAMQSKSWGCFTRGILINLHTTGHTTIASFLLKDGFQPTIKCVWCLTRWVFVYNGTPSF